MIIEYFLFKNRSVTYQSLFSEQFYLGHRIDFKLNISNWFKIKSSDHNDFNP